MNRFFLLLALIAEVGIVGIAKADVVYAQTGGNGSDITVPIFEGAPPDNDIHGFGSIGYFYFSTITSETYNLKVSFTSSVWRYQFSLEDNPGNSIWWYGSNSYDSVEYNSKRTETYNFAAASGFHQLTATSTAHLEGVSVFLNGEPLSISTQQMFPFTPAVPEPSTYALFAFGTIGMLMVMRRKKTA
jgi:hypothetical protein